MTHGNCAEVAAHRPEAGARERDVRLLQGVTARNQTGEASERGAGFAASTNFRALKLK
jgi:hypothetical protein